MKTKTKTKAQRKVLVILSNRLDAFHKPHFLELVCDEEGTILKESCLRSQPSKPIYDEVWENDEGRSDFASCHRFKRRYGHKWQARKRE